MVEAEKSKRKRDEDCTDSCTRENSGGETNVVRHRAVIVYIDPKKYQTFALLGFSSLMTLLTLFSHHTHRFLDISLLVGTGSAEIGFCEMLFITKVAALVTHVLFLCLVPFAWTVYDVVTRVRYDVVMV